MTKDFIQTIAFLASVLFWPGLAYSQESSNSAGGDASGSGGSVSYSIGQTIYTTNSTATGTLSQGVQQAYEIYSLGINNAELSFSLSVFPNPTSAQLTLQISDLKNLNWSYHIYDLQGKLVLNGPIRSQETLINTSFLPRATYFMNVSNQANAQIQSFKIIKS